MLTTNSLVTVPLTFGPTAVVTVNVSTPPAGKLGTAVNKPTLAGHTAPFDPAQVMLVTVRPLPALSKTLKAPVASVPSLVTVITNTALDPPTRVPVGPVPLTTTALMTLNAVAVTAAESCVGSISSAKLATIEFSTVPVALLSSWHVTENFRTPPFGISEITISTEGEVGHVAPPLAEQVIDKSLS